MDLGSRVKNVFDAPESTVASHGEVDNNTPGAYPETPRTESGPDDSLIGSNKPAHNKLHKKNDPRGWTEGTESNLGHRQTDSGVGLGETSPTGLGRTSNSSADYTYSTPTNTTGDTYSRQTQQPQSGLGSSLGGSTTTDPVRESLAHGGTAPVYSSQQSEREQTDLSSNTGSNVGGGSLGASALAAGGLTSSDNQQDKTARQPGDVAKEHPYWGDLPRGAGTYNTVTGHGSTEDQKPRQQELYQQETQGVSGTQGLTGTTGTTGTQNLTGQHPSTVGDISGVDRAQEPTSQTSTLGSSQRDPLRSDTQKDSRNKEALAGAGGAATATAAAATAYKMHERDNNRPEEERIQDTERPVEDKRERRRSFGLFHRGSKDDDHHTKEKVKEEKTKPVEEPKEEKKHRFGGLFHRSSADDKHDDAKDLKDREEAENKHDKSNTAAYSAGAVGAGGAAAYIANRARKSDDEVRDPAESSQRYQPESTATTGRTDPSYTQTSSTTRAEEPSSSSFTPATTAASAHPEQYRDTTTSDRATRDYDEREPKDSNKSKYAAAGAGAAALGGAGYMASRDNRKDEVESRKDPLATQERTTTGSAAPLGGSSLDTERRDPNVYSSARTGPPDTFGAGSTGLTGTSGSRHTTGLTGATGARDTSSRTADSTLGSSTIGTTGAPPAIASHANQGEYNVLSSGTPSGVRLDDHKDTTTSTQPTIPESTSTTRDSTHDKSKYAAAGLGAAGLGAAGTAAYKSRDNEDDAQLKKLEPEEAQQVKQFEREEQREKEPSSASRTIPLVGGHSAPSKSDKVFHKCSNCGEQNDISSYFEKFTSKDRQ